MADFKEMYLKLFRSQVKAISIMKAAQAEAEEMYILAPEADIRLLDGSRQNKDDTDE